MAVLACRRWLDADSKLCRTALAMALLLPLPSTPPLPSSLPASSPAAAAAATLSFLEVGVEVSPLLLGFDFRGRLC